MNILLGVTGSVAAELTIRQYYMLIEQNHNVIIVFTDNGLKLASFNQSSYKKITDVYTLIERYNNKKEKDYIYTNKMYDSTPAKETIITTSTDFERYNDNGDIEHVKYAEWADIMLISPCSANTLAKLCHGIADNALTAFALVMTGMEKPVWLALAMNTYMFIAPQTQENIKHITEKLGYNIIFPEIGQLKCGKYDYGVLTNIESVLQYISEKQKWLMPIKGLGKTFIPLYPHPFAFGVKRNHFYHTGVDLYAFEDTYIRAVEDGTVIDIGNFIEKEYESDSCKTQYIVIKGASGYILYGGLETNCKIGQKVSREYYLGKVKRVYERVNYSISHMSAFVCHIELYDTYHKPVNWKIGTKKPKNLKDPTNCLIQSDYQ